MLTLRYSTLKISFGYLDCPSCKQEFLLDYTVPILSDKLKKNLRFKARVEDMTIV